MYLLVLYEQLNGIVTLPALAEEALVLLVTDCVVNDTTARYPILASELRVFDLMQQL